MSEMPDPREELVMYLPELRALAISLTGDRILAEDLVQDTLEKAWANIESFAPGSNMWGWLFTILRNTWFSHNRRAWREHPCGVRNVGRTVAVPPDHDGRLALADIGEALLLLPPSQRVAVLLVGALGFGYHEAAAVCGVAPGTMKSRTNRGRRRLQELLGERSGECAVQGDRIMAATTGQGRGLW